MKALSLTQPWAWLVIHGGKNIENRKWNTHFRGTFLLHASRMMPAEEVGLAMAAQRRMSGCVTIPEAAKLERGGIVGVADLVAVLAPLENRVPWSAAGQHGFVLENVRPTPFVACRGALNFWDVPEEVISALSLAGVALGTP